MAAYRILAVDGVPVVGEVRIFPDEPPAVRRNSIGGHSDPGEWSVERLGPDAEVPIGGLPSNALRAVKLDHVRLYWPRIFPLFRGWERPESWGFTAGGVAPRRGPHGLGDLFYARWAERYVAHAKNTSRPIQALLAEEQAAGHVWISAAYIRDVIKEARNRRLLTRPPSRKGKKGGRAGGRLTVAAERLLEQTPQASASSTRRESAAGTTKRPREKRRQK
jgi:hypothetical protein